MLDLANLHPKGRQGNALQLHAPRASDSEEKDVFWVFQEGESDPTRWLYNTLRLNQPLRPVSFRLPCLPAPSVCYVGEDFKLIVHAGQGKRVGTSE
jgi:hypothetical protein